MPAIDTRGPYVKKTKRKPVYGPPVPKPRPIYGPPVPKPKLKPVKIVTTHRAKPVYGPPVPKAKPQTRPSAPTSVKSRTPRKPTPAERTNIRISAEGAKRAGEYQAKRPISDRPENTIASVDRFKQSRKYTEALVAAQVAKDVQERLKRARSAPDYTPKVLGRPISRTRAKELIGDPRSRAPKSTRTQAFKDPSSYLRTKDKSLAELIALRDTLKGDRKDQTKRLEKYTFDEHKREEAVKKAGTATGAAGLKVIDLVMRGNYASAGAASSIVKGESPQKVVKGAVRGLQGKDKKTYSTVLTDAGWKPKGALGKAVKGATAFTLDVALDPTTYATFGVGSVASKAAAKAGAQAAREAAEKATAAALAAGASREEATQLAKTAARRAGDAAAKKAAAAAPKGKGLVIKLGPKEIPGVRRGTAAYSRADRALTQKVVPAAVREKVTGSVRTGLRKTVRPMHRPPGIGKKEWEEAREGERRSRAYVSHEDARAATLAREVLETLPGSHHEAVIDALERNQLRKLPAEIRADPKAFDSVVNIRSSYREALRKSRRSGGTEGVVGDIRSWLDKGQKSAIERTVSSEQAAQKRNVTSLERHTERAAGKLDVATEAARGTAAREAAVGTEKLRGRARREAALANARAQGQAATQTERLRGQSKAEARAEQHAADIAFERAHAGARVSVAKPKPARTHEGALVAATRAHDAARGSLGKAKKALRDMQAKPVTRRRGVAALHAQVTLAERKVAEAKQGVTNARTALQTERKRTAGVAPAQADRLLTAIEGKGRVKPAPVARVVPKPTAKQAASAQDKALREAEQAAIDRAIPLLRPLREAEAKAAQAARRVPTPKVEPKAPGGKRMEKAGAKHGDLAQTLETAKTRAAAAEKIPARSLHESDREYLQRLHTYADEHGLRLLKARAEKLLAKEPSDLARGYYPRDFDDRVLKRLGIKPSEVEGQSHGRPGVGMKVARITSGMRRATQSRLAPVNAAREAAEQTPFSTNVPLVTQNYLKSTARTTAQGRFAQELAGQGTPVKVRRDAEGKIVQPKLKEGEALYRLGYKDEKFGLHPVDKILDPRNKTTKNANGQYVTLNPRLVEELLGEPRQIIPSLPGGAGYDKLSSLWRKRTIASPSYHIRNAISDMQTAYQTISGHKLPGTTVQGVRAGKAASEQSKQWRPVASDMTIPVAGKDMPMDEFLRMARREGVLDAGYFGPGGEIASMAGEHAERATKVGGSTGKASRAARKGGRGIKRLATRRENTTRLITFKGALDRGLDPEKAANVANKMHIDYGDLTEFERRALRRLTGFYTWTARSIPIQAEMLATRPGKFANVEKLRQNIGNATTGMTEEERQKYMTDAVLKGYPFVVGKNAISLGLQQTLLNEFPASLKPKDLKAWKDELDKFAWGNVNPILRGVIESRTGRNLVTKAEIEKRDRPLVPAPAWVQYLPEAMKQSKYLNVRPPKGKGPGGTGYTDERSGKPSWAWNGKADWKYDQLMLGFIGQAAALGSSGRNPNAPTAQKVGAIVGARIDPLDKKLAEKAKDQEGRPKLDDLKRQRGMLNQQGVDAEHPTPEWKRLNDLINKLEPKKTKKKKAGSDILGGAGTTGGGGADILGGGGGGGGTVDILK